MRMSDPIEFARRVAAQEPEKTDYLGGTCGQCSRNIDAAQDVLDATTPAHEQSDRAGVVARVRRIANLAGIPTALPKDDETVYGALFTCLGMIAGALERNAVAHPQPRFFTGQQD